jgi:hypothetical protein
MYENVPNLYENNHFMLLQNSFVRFRQVVESDEEDEEEEEEGEVEVITKPKQPAVLLLKSEPFDHCVCCKLALCGPYREKDPK